MEYKTDQRLFACYIRQPFFGSYSPPKRTCPRSAFDLVTTDHKRLMTVLLPRSYRQLILHFYFHPFNYTVLYSDSQSYPVLRTRWRPDTILKNSGRSFHSRYEEKRYSRIKRFQTIRDRFDTHSTTRRTEYVKSKKKIRKRAALVVNHLLPVLEPERFYYHINLTLSIRRL